MMQKNKSFMLALLLLTHTASMPSHTITSSAFKAYTYASQWVKTAFHAAKEYRRATPTLIGIGLCAALFTVLAKKQKSRWQELEKTHKEKQSLLKQSTDDAQRKKQEIKDKQTRIAQLKTEKNKKEATIISLNETLHAALIKQKEEEELRNNQRAQQQKCSALQTEITTTQQSIQETQNQIALLEERNNPANVLTHLNYWLQHNEEQPHDEDKLEPSESKYGPEKGKYDKESNVNH